MICCFSCKFVLMGSNLISQRRVLDGLLRKSQVDFLDGFTGYVRTHEGDEQKVRESCESHIPLVRIVSRRQFIHSQRWNCKWWQRPQQSTACWGQDGGWPIMATKMAIRMVNPMMLRQQNFSIFGGSAPSYRGEAYQHLDLEVKYHFGIRKAQPEVRCSRIWMCLTA